MRLINRKEAASILNVKTGTIGSWYRSGYLPSVEGSKGFLFDLNVCKSLSEERIKEKEREREKPKAESRYNYYQIKADLVGEELERFEKIREDLGYKFKGELLRKLILQTLSLIDKNYLYIKEQEDAEAVVSLFGDQFDWGGVSEVITKGTLRRNEYIKPTDR